MPTRPETLTFLGLDQPIPAEVNGRTNGVLNKPEWDAAYHPCPEAFPDEDVPTGDVIEFEDWSETSVYPGTKRQIQVYKPSGVLLDDTAVIVFNDGPAYLSRNGPVRAAHVLDVMHQRSEIAPTVAVFISPGRPDARPEAAIDSYDKRQSQRSLEYDSITPDYGTFIFEEVLPFVQGEAGVTFSDDPCRRTVCGISSGGICAFTAAWHHVDRCQRVLSHCGSFTDILGGHNYPSLIRRSGRRPIRVFMQSGENDVNSPFGNWPLANQAMASAFDWAGYDYRFEFGTGGHNLSHGGAIFADSLRWLWRA